MKTPLHILKSLPVVAAMLLFVAAGFADDPPPATLALPDLSGRMVKPFDDRRARALVFLFIRTDCPISNRYAPEVKRLQQRFVAKDVRFHLVYSGADETVAAIERHINEYGYRLSALRDPKHELVKLAGARVAPEAVVYAGAGKAGYRLVYRGRIDDRFVAFGKMRPAPTRRDLLQAIEAIVKGKPPAFTTEPAIGCYISKTDEQ
jgi:hypothetical protein